MSMVIKTYAGNQEWELWQAHSMVSFQGHHCIIEVPADEGYDHDFWDDDRFPLDGVDLLVIRTPGQRYCSGGSDRPIHCVRHHHWVKWYDGHQMMMLVTDGPIYICNESGDTIEAIGANARVDVADPVTGSVDTVSA